ncbi:sorting nexin-11 [Eucyclogobius newberryi]|uniref:sorting nexin-11 n=2 Tax=Eucyclogobius newberryi TaxID=166745 RepID=UPI003B5BC575
MRNSLEFVAVRVQDPRIQNEGSWNSFVDYKIFLHTNSKAFTAKTSCVRRRYSEFVWLKKKLQKNSGLVPVPDLPGKSLFSFSNDDFLERRRKGLQFFLDKVVHMTVCLSDSQLHLFLQTQLPVGHILDCVQGHTPYTVTDAILTYASSNRGYAQAQEEDAVVKERNITVSYESMESPVPHQPFQPNQLLPVASKPEDCLQEETTIEPQPSDTTAIAIQVHQTNDHLKAVVENCKHVSFFLGGSESPETFSYKEQDEQPGFISCVIEASAELHSPNVTEFEETEEATTEENTTAQKEEQYNSNTVSNSEEECEVNCNGRSKDEGEHVNEENGMENQLESKEGARENHFKFQDDVKNESGDAVTIQDYSHTCAVNSEGTTSEDDSTEQTVSVNNEENENLRNAVELDVSAGDSVQFIKPHRDEAVDISNTDIVYEDTRSLRSSNESIVQVSDEESVGDDAEVMQEANGDIHTEVIPEEITGHWSETRASSIFKLHMNGCPLEEEEEEEESISNAGSIQEEIEIVKGTNDPNNVSELTLSGNLDSNESESAVDLTENSDFSILETSCLPESVESKLAMGETLPSFVSLDASEDGNEAPLAEPVLNGGGERT